ncbi:alpha/beta hydrolase [Sphingomonas gilva]|uniref:Alpha/beta hydrolase n=2 Tax=Sphingomonas gilva TaxID=2305907 RepID=A0A396RQ47_9SPHN|nr:alpha/beta hydrolase [Sphingomonas gilva]
MTACSTAAPETRAPMTWDDLTSRARPAPDVEVRYGEDPYQVVDLWKPAGDGPFPTVLMVHGGCWTTSVADRTLMAWIADDLRGRGIAVWNIDYRGVDRPGGGYPGTFHDVARAADALRANAAAHGLDLSRVVAVGHSAGGHLALWLAGRPKLPADSRLRTGDPLPIASVVSLGGLPDLEQARAEEQGCGPQVIDQLVGPPTISSRQVYRDTSIPQLAPLGVEQVLVNGDADRIIPTHFAGDYAAKMRAAGDEVTVHIVPDQGHVELIAPDSPAWARAAQAIEQALGR